MPHMQVLCASHASAKGVNFSACGSASSIASARSVASTWSFASASTSTGNIQFIK